ncbi:hypothetical protein [Pseudomonas sp. PLMAX]|uniref:hypothetical protein n=1 Tax=Pseudomonas sp. PLMAX TaxID=2201998 RepID=UPI0038B80AA3
MLVFSPRFTQVSIDDQVLTDLDVLLHIDDEFTVADGEQHLFNLMSIRRLLLKYPNLQLLNGWSKSLIEHGQKLEMAVVRDLPGTRKSKQYAQLSLQKHSVLSRFELTPYLSVTPRENVLDLQGQVSTGTGIRFKDVSKVDFYQAVDFSGMGDGESVSLSMTRLADICYAPIVLELATHEVIEITANQSRTELDYANTKRETITMASTDICLREVIHAVLMDINLDDEEDFNEEMDHLRRMIRCLNPDSQE